MRRRHRNSARQHKRDSRVRIDLERGALMSFSAPPVFRGRSTIAIALELTPGKDIWRGWGRGCHWPNAASQASNVLLKPGTSWVPPSASRLSSRFSTPCTCGPVDLLAALISVTKSTKSLYLYECDESPILRTSACIGRGSLLPNQERVLVGCSVPPMAS